MVWLRGYHQDGAADADEVEYMKSKKRWLDNITEDMEEYKMTEDLAHNQSGDNNYW